MKQYAIEAAPAVEADVGAAHNWYEREEPGLGFEFLEELRAAYQRILVIRSVIKSPFRHSRALMRRFPYAITEPFLETSDRLRR
ncbi:MAG: hypothetical protein ACR2LM_19135 [Pyrinomonadaceae bacterium]